MHLPRTLHLGRLEAVPLHLDPLRLRVVALLRQGHLEEVEVGGVGGRGRWEVEVEVEVGGGGRGGGGRWEVRGARREAGGGGGEGVTCTLRRSRRPLSLSPSLSVSLTRSSGHLYLAQVE